MYWPLIVLAAELVVAVLLAVHRAKKWPQAILHAAIIILTALLVIGVLIFIWAYSLVRY